MAAIKDVFSAPLVADLAAELETAWPAFDVAGFSDDALDGLDALELKARIAHITTALDRHLPPDFTDLEGVLRGALESPGFDGWMTVPVSDLIAVRGIGVPDRAMPLLADMTGRFSCEWAVRPFIARDPGTAVAWLTRWTGDPDAHVRRLASEGCRPRLPWATRLTALIDDPTPVIAVLDRLIGDPSEYVRRSVANNLNDITKDHPDLAKEVARRWSADGDPGTAWIVRRGLRSLASAGDPEALALLGYDEAAPVTLEHLVVSPSRIAVGESVEITFALRAQAPTPVVVQYLVHHAGARGARAPRAFALARRTLGDRDPIAFRRRHAFAERSIRRLYPGPHRVEIQVNGRVLGGVDVELLESDR